MPDKDVVLSVAELDPDEVDEVEDAYETITDRQDEAEDCLADLGVLAEAAFLFDKEGSTYLATYIESEGLEETQRRYQQSDAELDVMHREVIESAVTGPPEDVAPLFQATVGRDE